ncbi:hypothetical protein T492DRAFT_1110028 [Pavlovales sp. CCMP2436]|nr:hypothetical protein T492DRAFT_1110028 [Pavlovales sp. CCMP2436]
MLTSVFALSVFTVARTGLVAGPARGVERHLSRVLPSIAAIAQAAFDPPLIAFYESGSHDRSRELLEAFCTVSPQHRHVLPTVEPTPQEHERMKYGRVRIREANIAHARNQLLAWARLLRVEYYFAVDVDEVNYYYFLPALQHVFDQPKEQWDGAAANQRVYYYDRYALRVGREDEPCAPANRGPSSWSMPGGACRCLDGDLSAWWHLDSAPQQRFPSALPPIRVLSAFGGAAIYRLASLGNCSYDFTKDCEHVSFHKCLVEKNGGKMTIQPAMINSGMDGPLGTMALTRLLVSSTPESRCMLELELAAAVTLVWCALAALALVCGADGRVPVALALVLGAFALRAAACPGPDAAAALGEENEMRYSRAVWSVVRTLIFVAMLLAAGGASVLALVWCAVGRLSERAQRQELGCNPALEERALEDAPLIPGTAHERRPVERASGLQRYALLTLLLLLAALVALVALARRPLGLAVLALVELGPPLGTGCVRTQ